MIFFQTFCPGSYRLCHKHRPIFSVYVCDILPTRCLIFGLFVCLIACAELALYVSMPHAVFLLLCLPVFSLWGQTAEMKSPGTSVTHVATQEDAHSHKTMYCCSFRYQTANISIQTRHSPTPPNTASSWQSVSNKLFSLGKSCKSEKLKTSLRDRGHFCFQLWKCKWTTTPFGGDCGYLLPSVSRALWFSLNILRWSF